VAAQLNKESDVEAKIVKGRLGELSVSVDGNQIVRTNPLWYPLPSTMVKKAKANLKS
jgi:hypothetical protein